jgi:hypothetical protein
VGLVREAWVLSSSMTLHPMWTTGSQAAEKDQEAPSQKYWTSLRSHESEDPTVGRFSDLFPDLVQRVLEPY